MKILSCLICLLVINQFEAQQYFNVNLAGSSVKLYGGLSYEYITESGAIVGFGLNYGQFGSALDEKQSIDTYNEWLFYEDRVLKGTRSEKTTYRNIGFGLDVSLGKAFELSRTNFLDFRFFVSCYSVKEHHSHYMGLAPYFPSSYDTSYVIRGKTHHYSLSNGLKLSYRKELSPKVLFRIGAGLNFFFPIKNEDYQPLGSETPMVGLEYQADVSLIFKLKRN